MLIYEKFAKKHFSQLIGYSIVAFKLEKWSDGDIFPVLFMKKANDFIKVTVSCDEEGNQGGHLFIDKLEKE